MCMAYTLKLLNFIHLKSKVDTNEQLPFNTLCRAHSTPCKASQGHM